MSKAYGVLPAADLPSAPTDLATETVTAGYVSLTWSGDGTSYQVYRDGSPIGSTTSSAFYTDPTVAPSTLYSYQVQAFNAAGGSALSDALAVTTSANSAPGWSLSDQTLLLGVAYSLDLSGNYDDTDGHAITCSLTSGTVPGLSLADNVYSGTPTVVGVSSLTFDAYDGYDHSTVTVDFTVSDPDIVAPSVPTGVSASANGSTVTVTWTASTDATGVAHYRVFRDGAFRATGTASPYVESGVPAGSYNYTVSAVDSSTNANESAQSSAAPVSVVPQNPDTPINFTASAVSDTQIDLAWAAGPNGATPDDYDLAFSTAGANGPWTSIPFTGTGTTYSHTGLTKGVLYDYRVRAAFDTVKGNWAYTSGTLVAAADFIIPAATASRTINRASTTAYGTTTWASLATGGKTQPQPGDVIQLAPGTHGPFKFQNFVGTSSARYLFRPDPSAVSIIQRTVAATGGFIFELSACNYVTVDGRATGGELLGIKVTTTATNDAPSCFVKCSSRTHHVTIRGVEVDGKWPSLATDGIGIQIHDNGDKIADFPGVFQENMIVEYCHVYNCEGEGMYLGPNYVASSPSIPLRNITVRYNNVEDCGWNGIEGKCWFEGTNAVHHNVIKRTGKKTATGQNVGLSLLSCDTDVYNNWVEESGAAGINLFMMAVPYAGQDTLGYGTYADFVCEVYNNVTIRNGLTGTPNSGIGVSADGNSTPTPAHIKAHIYNNTSVDNAGYGVSFQANAGVGWARNNILLGNTAGAYSLGSGGSTQTGNLTTGTPASVFTNPATDDYTLLAAQAVAGGSVLGADVATTDYADAARVLATADKGAYERA